MTEPENGTFKPFQGWADQYEAKKEEKQKDSDPNSLANQAKAKARQAMIEKIHFAITENLMKILLEVSSKLCTPVENSIREKDSDLSVVLNSMNGMILTYRFGRSGHKKFLYIRKLAATQLVDSISKVFSQAETGGVDLDVKMQQLEDLINKEILGKQAEIKAVIEALPFFQPDAAQIGDAVGAAVQAKVNQRVGGAGAEAAQAAAASVSEQIESNSEAVDEGILKLQQLLKTLAIAKVEAAVPQGVAHISQLLQVLRKLYEEFKKKVDEVEGTDDQSALMLEECEKVHQEVLRHVSRYVDGLVGILNAMMAEESSADE